MQFKLLLVFLTLIISSCGKKLVKNKIKIDFSECFIDIKTLQVVEVANLENVLTKMQQQKDYITALELSINNTKQCVSDIAKALQD
jgi:hypothetical protein